MVMVDGMIEPVSILEAMNLPEWEKWQRAIERRCKS